MNVLPKVIIWLDPGGTTGIAYWVHTPDRPLSQWLWGRIQVSDCSLRAGLVSTMHQLTSISRHAEPFSARPTVTVGYESFDFRHEERERDRINYIAAEVIGATRYWAAERPHVQLFKTNAGIGKSGFWDDDKIKKLGLWVPGYRHAMDATRHLLYHMAFTLSMRELFEPLRPVDQTAASFMPRLEWQ